jgi:hypothetical protein
VTATAGRSPSPAQLKGLARRGAAIALRLEEAERQLRRPVRQARNFLADVEAALAGSSDEDYPVLLVVTGARDVLEGLEALRALLNG